MSEKIIEGFETIKIKRVENTIIIHQENIYNTEGSTISIPVAMIDTVTDLLKSVVEDK